MMTWNPGDGVEKLVHSYIDSADFKWYSHFAISYKAKMCLPNDPANALLGIYPRETKMYIHTKPLHEYSKHLYLNSQKLEIA